MQIPTILKGDDSGPIVLVMDEGHDYTGATLVVAYSGVVRKFTGLTPGGTVSLAFTHEETAGFNLGCKPVLMRLVGPSGAVETVENAEMKIKVTDCLGEVNAGGSFMVKPGAAGVPVTDVGDLSANANVGALYAKVNEIVRVLAQRSLLSLAALLSAAAFATVQTAQLADLDPSSVVVTNVTESSGSLISDGTNTIDAAGNTYTNGVVAGKLRARDDRVWGERTYTPWQFETLPELAPAFEGATVDVEYYTDEYGYLRAMLSGLNDGWEGDAISFPIEHDQTNMIFLISNYSQALQRSIAATRIETTVYLALSSDIASSGLDTNAVRDIALWPATNYTDSATGEVVRLVGALESSVSSLESSKRDKTDMMTDWWIYPDGSKIRLYHVHHIEGSWYWQDTLDWVSDSPWSLFAASSELGDEETIDLYDGMTFELVARMTRDTLATTSDLSNSVQRVEHQLDEKADSSDLAPVAADASSALTYSRFVYYFCLGSASCHLITTNYVFGSDALSRTRFAWQSDMDAATVPASMRLVDIVGGETNVVWDSRDWTVWYWNYRLAKYRAERETEDAALRALISSRCPISWASYTACGLTNPAATTTWLDTPSVVLSAGYAWQHQLDVGGVGYWCIQGNGFEVGGSGTNATLKISDFEGNEVFRIRKGSAMLAPVSSEMTESVGFDGEWFWCQMKCDAQPEGEFAVDLADVFYPEGDACPAVVREYEDRGGGVWRCYWKVRPGIQSASCFGRFKVQVGSETTVEYSNAPTVPAIRFGNYKLEPVIPSGARVGDTVTFKITEITQ